MAHKAKVPRKITMQLDKDINGLIPNKMKLSGWYDGTYSYLWFGDEKDRCTGTLSGRSLYRLAKNIVEHFEGVKR